MPLKTALTGTVGDTILVKSFQQDAYGGTSTSTVTWTTDTAAVATVSRLYNSNDAIIYCLTAGTATITATLPNTNSAAFILTVNAASTPDGYSISVEADKTFQPVNKTTQTKTS